MIRSNRNEVLETVFKQHQENVTGKLLFISFIYLCASLCWNLVAIWWSTPFARADTRLLAVCLLVLTVIMVLNWRHIVPTLYMKHLALTYLIFLTVCLYFTSGYKEAWSYFLFVPLIAGLYGKINDIIVYPLINLVIMLVVCLRYPLVMGIFDGVDVSNRILLYLIVATFSHLLYKQLSGLYFRQAEITIRSAEEMLEQMVKSFVIAVEAKDAYTFGHSDRVSKYAVALASTLPEYQDPALIKDVQMAGLLHDIGKINIPERVLTKEGSLTKEEYELIKTHTIVGAKMIEKMTSMPLFRMGILFHHERWDGQGYPTGIKEENIPLIARILAIADAFDAMTSNRAYRNALPLEEAFFRLKSGSGTQFDPALVACVFHHQASWIHIYQQANNDREHAEFEAIMDLA
jgi:putative nucleotidyltransferase with HDIG domain